MHKFIPLYMFAPLYMGMYCEENFQIFSAFKFQNIVNKS